MHKKLHALHSTLMQKEEELRRVNDEMVSLCREKLEAVKLVNTLKAECLSLKHRITLYQDDLLVANEVIGELNIFPEDGG